MTLYTGNMTESDKMYQATGYDMYKPDSLMAFGAAFEKGLRMGPGMSSARKQEREGPLLQEKETAVTAQVPGFESEFLNLARRPGMGFTESPKDEYAPMPEDVWKDSVDYREDLKWDESFTPRKAKYIAEAKDEENRLNDILDRSKHGVIEFTGEMAGGMLDPFNVAAMFVPVVKGAQTAAWIGKYGKVGGRALTGAIEGVVGASLIEPIVLGNASQEQMDYNAYDSLMNISAGLILGSALHTGLGFAGDVLGKAKAKTKKTALDTTVGQLADGRQADISPIIETDPGLTGQPRMSEVRYKADIVKTKSKIDKIKSDIESVKSKIKSDEKSNFKKWFKRSEVVDEAGDPLMVFHGTYDKFDVFDTRRGESMPSSKLGAFFTADEAYAKEAYAFGDKGTVVPSYLSSSKMYKMTMADSMKLTDEGALRLRSKLERKGYDGIFIKDRVDNALSEYVVFEPNQIKSVKNFGEWDPKDPNIFGKRQKGLDDLETLKLDLEQEAKMSYDEYIDRIGTKEPSLPKTKTETIDSILDDSGELKPRKRAWEDQEQVDAVNAEEPEPILAPDEELVKIAEDTTVIENDLINRIQNGQVLEDESLEAAMAVINEAKIDAEKKSKFVDNIVECFLANGMSLA